MISELICPSAGNAVDSKALRLAGTPLSGRDLAERAAIQKDASIPFEQVRADLETIRQPVLYGRPHAHPDRPWAGGSDTWNGYLRRTGDFLHGFVDRHEGDRVLFAAHGETVIVAHVLLLAIPLGSAGRRASPCPTAPSAAGSTTSTGSASGAGCWTGTRTPPTWARQRWRRRRPALHPTPPYPRSMVLHRGVPPPHRLVTAHCAPRPPPGVPDGGVPLSWHSCAVRDWQA